jgi:hypothetical protein
VWLRLPTLDRGHERHGQGLVLRIGGTVLFMVVEQFTLEGAKAV